MISALDRLRALRAGKSLDLPALTHIDDLPMDWRTEFEERAAILEYDGGLTRDEADVQALKEIVSRMNTVTQETQKSHAVVVDYDYQDGKT
jgi:hypothetical protein